MFSPSKLLAVTACVTVVVGLAACSSDEQLGAGSSPSTGIASTVVVATVATSAPLLATTTTPVTTAAPQTTTTTTTTLAPTTTPAPTTTTQPPGAALPLRFDGIGDVRFGTDPEAAIGVISGVLGAPTNDTGWVDAASRVCPGNEVRFVSWGDLTMQFSDDTPVSPGRRHFFAWVFGPPAGVSLVPQGMKTVEGVGIGSTVAELRAAYPAAEIFPADELAGAYSALREGLLAFLSDTADTGVITSMVGGQGCGE